MAANVIVGFAAQIISFALSFVSRTFFLRYIGVEILGLSGTLSSVVSALSLLDLGFYSVVVFRLYDPLIHQRYDECNEILAVLKRFYLFVAGAISIILICIAPFLKFFLNGIEITPFVYFVYALISLNTVVTYFVAYKRTLLYADGKDSVAKAVDSACNISFAVIRILILILTKNFLLHQAAGIVQTLVSNLILHVYCKRRYLWMRSAKISRAVLMPMLSDGKNAFAGKFAEYVYGATDNIVISIFLKTVTVGFYSNYLMLSSSLRVLGYAVISQIAPFVGKKYADNKDSSIHEKDLETFSFMCFVMAGAFVVPLYLLSDSFIGRWLGDSYILPTIAFFLCVNLYVEIQQVAFTLYMAAAGFFAEDRTTCVVSAVCNIVSSVILVKVLGLPGVILGSVISQLVYWFSRGRCVLRKLFNSDWRYILRYITMNILYVVVIVLSILLIDNLLPFIYSEQFLLQFFFQGVVCELCFAVICIICFSWTKPFREFVNNLKKRFANNDRQEK